MVSASENEIGMLGVGGDPYQHHRVSAPTIFINVDGFLGKRRRRIDFLILDESPVDLTLLLRGLWVLLLYLSLRRLPRVKDKLLKISSIYQLLKLSLREQQFMVWYLIPSLRRNFPALRPFRLGKSGLEMVLKTWSMEILNKVKSASSL